jgi:hypothetical protein
MKKISLNFFKKKLKFSQIGEISLKKKSWDVALENKSTIDDLDVDIVGGQMDWIR